MALINCRCCGHEVSEHAFACPHCGEPVAAQAAPQQNKTIYPDYEQIPEAATKWNWGGFCFGWFWGVFNGVLWPMLTLLVLWIPFVGWATALAVNIMLGIKGSEMAWRNKHWNSEKHFDSVQTNWAIAGLVCFVLMSIGTIIGLAFAALDAMTSTLFF